MTTTLHRLGCLATATLLLVGAHAALAQSLDVDQSGAPVDPFTDVVYVARRLLLQTPVPPSFRLLDPTIPDDALIAARVDALGAALDVDESGGPPDPFTDVVYCARTLLGRTPVPPSFRAADPHIPDDAVIAEHCRHLDPRPSSSTTPTPSPSPPPATSTLSPSATPSATSSATLTIAPPTASPSPPATATPSPSATPSATSGATVTIAPPAASPSPSATLTLSPSATPSATVTIAPPTASPSASATVTLSPSPMPSALPSATVASAPTPPDPCASVVTLPPTTEFPVNGSTLGKMDRAKQATCGAGGNGAPDETYEYQIPETGHYDIAVQAQGFTPLLSLRRGGCGQSQTICGLDGAGPDVLDGAVGFEAMLLQAGETVAIVVDGEGPDGGPFTLAVHRRRPDLVVSDVAIVQQPPFLTGSLITVRATIRNQGDEDAGLTTLRFGAFRDPTAQYPIGTAEVSCALPNGLPQGAAVVCTADTQLTLPAVAAGTYALVARAASTSDERETANNSASAPLPLGVRGALFAQRAFRAADGTVYQVLVGQPPASATRADRFEVNTVTLGAAGAVRSCVQSPTASGANLLAAVGSPTALPRSGLRRTIRLRPTDLADLESALAFDPAAGGKLTMGIGPPITVCDRAATCGATAVPLYPFTTATADVPAACEAAAPSGSFCPTTGAKYALAFGLAASGGTCTSPSSTHIGARVCEPIAGAGLMLDPGEAIVLVWHPGRDAVDVQASVLGITSDDEGTATGCLGNQFVTATLTGVESLPSAPLLSFVTAVRGETDPLPVAVSPDNAHVYTGGNGVIASYRRQPNGALTKIDEERQGEFSVLGISNVFGLAVSPDGASVYAAGRGDNAVAVFSRNTDPQSANFGTLSFQQVLLAGAGGADGIGLPIAIAVDPQGTYVYVAGDDALTVFARNTTPDAGFGRLTAVPVQIMRDGVGVRTAVALSPNGTHVYVSGDNALAVFARDASTGQVALLQVLHDNQGGVDGLGGANHIAFAPLGDFVYVTGGDDDSVAVFARNTDAGSALFGRLTFVEAQRNGARGVFGLDLASAVALSPGGDFVYALGLVSHAVAIFSRHPGTGQLTFKTALTDQLTYPEAVAVDGAGQNVYVSGRFGNGLVAFARDATSGLLPSVVDTERLGVGGLDDVMGLLVSKDGKYLYAAGNNDDAVVVFGRDSNSGRLTAIETQRNGVNGVSGLVGARGLALSPDDKHLYIASQGDVIHDTGAIAVFSRAADTGRLSFVEAERFRTAGASDVVVNPAGGTVYSAAVNDSRVVQYTRSSSGALSAVAALQYTLAPPIALALNPIGSRLYVASRFAFTIDVRNADLSSAGTANDSVQDEIEDLALDPGGTFLYAVKPGANAVSVFSAPAFGATSPSLVEVKKNGVGGISGIAGAYVVQVSPSGKFVLVGGIDEDSLAAFSRDATTGKLSLIEVHRDGQNGVDGLAFPQGIAFAPPDGRHVYVAGGTDNAIAIFAVNE